MDLKKIDFKTYAIIILGIALIISFFFGQKSHINTHKDDITLLHKNNAELIHRNDSLTVANAKLDKVITSIELELNKNSKKLADTQIELDKLNKKRNEIPTYVNHLSATGVSSAFSNYLEAKSPNAH